MSFLAITALLNFLTCTISGLFVFLRKSKNVQYRLYFALSIALSIESFGYFFWQLSESPETAIVWFRLLVSGVILVNVLFLHFVFSFVNQLKKKKNEIIIHYCISGVFILFNFLSLMYGELEPRYDLGFWPNPTVFFNVYLVFWFFQCAYGLVWLIRGYKTSTAINREQIKYVILAVAIVFPGGACNFPMWYGIYFPPYPNILISLYVVIAGYAVIKYRILELKSFISRLLILLIVYAFVAVIPFWYGFKSGFSFESFILMFILASSGPILYRFFKEKAEGLLLSKDTHIQNILYNAADAMVKEHNIDKISKLLILGVESVIRADFAAVFIEEKENKCYRLKKALNFPEITKNLHITHDHPVVEFALKNRKTVFSSEIKHLFRTIPVNEFYLFIPCCSDTRLLGFMILGGKKNKAIYTREDIRTFETVSNQTALAIENCFFHEERKNDQQRIFEAEKLTFIGGMAEGVAHQIKNRLTHFSFCAEEIKIELKKFSKNHPLILEKVPDLKKTFDSLGEISSSLIDNVIRTDSVIQGIINYSRAEENEGIFSDYFIDEIINGAIDLVKIKHDIERYPIDFYIERSNMVFCIMNQLIECFYNIIDNCIEAIEEKEQYHLKSHEKDIFLPCIRIKVSRIETSCLIEITDNGVGIIDENRPKIFAPYFTTKSSFRQKPASGVGLYSVRRMIEENHHGSLWFESEYLIGTTFYIKLPVKKAL